MRMLRGDVIEQHGRAISMREILFEIAIEVTLVPKRAFFLPRAIAQVPPVPIVPMLLKRVFVQAMPKPCRSLQTQVFTLRKHKRFFVLRQLCAARDVAFVTRNL